MIPIERAINTQSRIELHISYMFPSLAFTHLGEVIVAYGSGKFVVYLMSRAIGYNLPFYEAAYQRKVAYYIQ